MSKKAKGKKGRKVSRKAVDSRVEKMLSSMQAFKARNHLVLRRRDQK